MSKPHVFPIRVYFEDTDAGGVVYYANYLKFAERARTEMLRDLGGERHAEIMEKAGIVYAVRHCEADYRKPALLDDLLSVHTWVTEAKGASLSMVQAIRRDGEDLVGIKVRLACMDLKTRRPARLPDGARTLLKAYVCANSAQDSFQEVKSDG